MRWGEDTRRRKEETETRLATDCTKCVSTVILVALSASVLCALRLLIWRPVACPGREAPMSAEMQSLWWPF